MAQSAVHLDRETFSCSICLELLNDPVTIPCGHSYCFNCIKDHWDREDEKGIHSCPQCRKILIPRPQLLKSTMLAALVDELKKTGLQATSVLRSYAGDEDVACDVCTGRKLKALKSCLVCRASYCDTHLQPHFHSPAFVKHQLVDPSKNLQENICSRHDEVMKIFCHSDQQCICYLCCMEEHKGHDTVSAATVRREKQEELQESRQTIQQRIQDREQDVKVLQQKVKGINNLQEKLEQEITELKNKDAELQQLSLSEDHCHFLHNYPSLSQKLQELLGDVWTNISPTPVDVSLSEESKTRAEFLRYSCNITLDPNTAHRQLLCDGNRRLTWLNGGHLSNPDHPDRFIDYCQVLSRESLTGRCYWEVEIGGFGLNVAVTYKNIRRSGQESRFGTNDQSWCLDYYGCCLRFKNISIGSPISGPWSSTVGVYLDHPAGVVSFYSVSDTMTLLFRVKTSFTQPLHAGLFLFDDDGGAEFVKLK